MEKFCAKIVFNFAFWNLVRLLTLKLTNTHIPLTIEITHSHRGIGVIISLSQSWFKMEENMDILHHIILITTVLNCITLFNGLNFFYL